MISFSKSKFLVLGFVFAAVLLVPVDDAFAFSITLIDDFHMNLSKYTISGYEDDRLYYHSLQKDGSPHSTGTSRSHDGWSSPNSLPDGILPGSYTSVSYTHLTLPAIYSV